ncbi:hypothetical protein ACIPUC_14260 [Streptomyces sp. LARHCF249]
MSGNHPERRDDAMTAPDVDARDGEDDDDFEPPAEDTEMSG